MRTLSFAFIPFILGSTLLAACATDAGGTTPGEDELAGDNGNDGSKVDEIAVQDTFVIYTTQKNNTNKNKNHNSNTHVDLKNTNHTTTTSTDGSKSAACSVKYLDFSALGLTTTQAGTASDKLQASAATPEIGPQLLVRGKFVTTPTQSGDAVTFQVTELWQAQLADASTDGTFVMVRDAGIRCITAPCASLNENRLNSTRNLNIHGIDWPQDLSASLQSKIYDATTKVDGVILVGDRTHGKENGQTTNLRSVNQAFLRVK